MRRLRRSGRGPEEDQDGARHADQSEYPPASRHRASPTVIHRGPFGPRFGVAALALLGLLAILGAVAAVPAPARAADDLPSELTTIEKVEFEGRRSVPEKKLRAVLKTRSSSRVLFRDRPLLRLDFLRADTASVENVYHQHGYLDARVVHRLKPGKERGTVIVSFVIEEGRRTKIGRVDLTGVTVMPVDPLRRKLFARPGKPFNPYFLPADTVKIAEQYRDRGYFPVIHPFAVRDSATRAMNVNYAVDEGPRFMFGETNLTNLDELTVSEHFVRRELLVKPGTIFRASRVQESVERLYETGVFSQVRMAPLIDSTYTTVGFDLTLRERKPRWVDAGIGSGTSERLLATGEWGHRNLLRRGMQGELAGRLALDGQARFLLSRLEASLVEPWLLATRMRGVLTVYHENRHERDSRRLIEHQAEGVSFQVQRRLGRFARISLTQDNTFARENQTFRDPTLTDSLKAILNQDVTPRFTTHRLQLGVDRDTRDFPIQVTRGSLQSATAEIAGGPLKGTSSFTKGHISSAWYTPVRPGWQIATHARAGIIAPYGKVVLFSQANVDPAVARVPELDRFKLGGVSSLRGYDENELPPYGGLVLLQGNIELRGQVYGPFGFEVFVDAGNVWSRRDRVRHGKFAPEISGRRMTPDDVRWVVGFGPRLELPFGPLRIDYSWWLRPDETGKRQRGIYQFAIGPSF